MQYRPFKRAYLTSVLVSNSLDIDLAKEVHEYFRLSRDRAFHIIKEIRQFVQAWRKIATRMGISKSEQELKSKAFQQANG